MTAFGNQIIALTKGVPSALAGKTGSDPNTAILQSIENAIVLDPYFNVIALNNLAQGGALSINQNNGVSINTVLQSLVTGEIWLYLNASVSSSTSLAQAPPPFLRLIAGGPPQMWFPPQTVQTITLYSVSITSAFGSISLMQE